MAKNQIEFSDNSGMDKKELERQIKLRDRVVRVMSKDGKFRCVAIKNTNAAITAQKNHNLPFIPAFFLARQMSAASLMAAFLKGEERITAEVFGEGLVSRVLAEAVQAGEVRGYVEYDEKINTAELSDIGETIGDKAAYSVTRVLYGKDEPITGLVPIQKGDIATDLAFYYAQSEQIPSAVILDVDFDDEGNITCSGGLIVQSMPGATDEDLQEVFNSLQNMKRLSHYYNELEMTPMNFMKEVLPFEFEVLRSVQVDFFCRCTKENFMSKLVTLSKDEIVDMQKTGQDELRCFYCNKTYKLEEEDFKALIAEKNSKNN